LNEILMILLWFGIQCARADTHECLYRVPALPVYAQGGVTPFREGLAWEVRSRRMRWYFELQQQYYGYMPDCLCALNQPHVGDYVVVFYPEVVRAGRSWIICYVVDTARPEHGARREEEHNVIEVDHDTFTQLGNGPVVVSLLEFQP
jgi:hypothetical protein